MKISQNKLVSLLVVLVLLLGLSPALVMAAPSAFQSGDVFASVSNGQVQQWREISGNMTLIDTLSDGLGGFTTGSTTDANGNLYVTNFSNTKVVKYAGPNTPHTILQVIDTNAHNSGGHSESIVFDTAGNFYVGHPDGDSDIQKYSANGTYITQYDVAVDFRGSDWIDLAADQKTMYYACEGRIIFRYDVSTSTQLANFATLPGSGEAYALRLLPDGGLLVADGSNVKRLDSTGNVTQTYDVAGVGSWFALNRDPDGTSFWSGSFQNDTFYQFDIDTGTLLDTVDTGLGNSHLWGLSVYGEITQSGGGVQPEPTEVGGTVYPVNKLAMLAPWITLVAVLILGTILAVNRRRAQS